MSPAKLPAQLVLPIHPKEYPTQGKSHCGAYAVNAVLSAYGLNDDVREPWELHTATLSRISGSSTSLDYYPSILRSYGLIARARNADGLAADEKIALLKGLLVAGNPVILSVASHFNRETGDFQTLKGKVASHWISLWGWDDGAGVFHTYDSLVSKELSDADAPIGNKSRSYETVLRIWPGSLLSRLMLGRYSYILIKRQSA